MFGKKSSLLRGGFTILLYFFIFSSSLFTTLAHAQLLPPQGSFEVEIGANVGSESASPTITTTTIPVSISGFASPNASIVLLDSSNTSIASVTADALGNFIITNLQLPATSAQYCFRVVDFKRIGTSESCLTINPSTLADITNVYLPPTIAVEKAEISEGEEALIYGYTMPNAQVKLQLSNGEIVTIQADENGYYEYRNDALRAGDYSFVASASYNNTDSLTPNTKVSLKLLSPEEILKRTKEALKEIDEKKGFPWWLLIVPLLLLSLGAGLWWYLSKNDILRQKLLSLLPPGLARFHFGGGLHHDKLLKQLEKESNPS